jgi:hypothetical protein
MNGTERTHQGQTMTQPDLAANIRTAMNQLIAEHESGRQIINQADLEMAQRFVTAIDTVLDVDDTNAATGLFALAVVAGTMIAGVTPPEDYANLAMGMSSLMQAVARKQGGTD